MDDAAAFPLTVGEVAELLGVSGHTLRYYERIGLVDVGRSVSGQRRYDRAALGRVIFITRLRWSGMSIRDITEYVQLVEKGDSTTDERLALLHRHPTSGPAGPRRPLRLTPASPKTTKEGSAMPVNGSACPHGGSAIWRFPRSGWAAWG